ncbi:MAG TPA: hypothetical protein PLW48_06425 [Alphaproteobacteria bacterium]|nr:hypothetical protein [Alphaproteobacteria bacterium]
MEFFRAFFSLLFFYTKANPRRGTSKAIRKTSPAAAFSVPLSTAPALPPRPLRRWRKTDNDFGIFMKI